MACTLPSSFAALAAVPRTTISSGCKVIDNPSDPLFGSVPCNPEEMRANAERKIKRSLSLDAYALARNIATEVGSSASIAAKVALALSTLGQAARGSRGTSASEVILASSTCKFGQGSACLFGRVHGGGNVSTAPFGRFTASSQDPTLQDIAVAQFTIAGEAGEPLDPKNFARGADDQWSPLSSQHGDRAAALQVGLNKLGGDALQGHFWVGAICGIDPVKVQFFRRRNDLTRGSAAAAAEVVRLKREYVANAAAPGVLGLNFAAAGFAGPALLLAATGYGVYRFVKYQRAKR